MEWDVADTYTKASELPIFDNTGDRPICVPGFNEVPVGFELPRPDRYAHGLNDWAMPHRLTAREVAMLQLMDIITDKPNWHIDIFNADLVAQWREETRARELISLKAWNWCLAELEDKATHFARTRRVLVLDAGSVVCKSDISGLSSIQTELNEGVSAMLATCPPDARAWHPSSNELLLDIVEPSLYALIYGRTRVLEAGGKVDLKTYDKSYGQGTVASRRKDMLAAMLDVRRRSGFRGRGGSHFAEAALRIYMGQRFSTHAQWLPCEASFEGDSGTAVRITSYINNLHPVDQKPLYSTIEKLISASIEPWNEVLVRHGNGRVPMRIRTYGVTWEDNRRPSDIRAGSNDTLDQTERVQVEGGKQEAAVQDFGPDSAQRPVGENGRLSGRRGPDISSVSKRGWVHPEPGDSFTYKDWRSGKGTSKAVVPKRDYGDQSFQDDDHEYYSESIQNSFRVKGLQVMVKIGGIELTPEKPCFAGDEWHTEGLLNEHIVATSLFVFDAANVTDLRISFRQETTFSPLTMAPFESDQHETIMKVFGIEGNARIEMIESIQELGSVTVPSGRLVAFPNTLQNSIQPVSLVDKKQPGHLRFVVLGLVDPHYRICSTRNVPPQQHDWWLRDAFSQAPLAKHGLPAETIASIEQATGYWPMGSDEAAEHRDAMARDRASAMVSAAGMVERMNF